MSHDRRARHVFGVAVCIAVMVASTGCRNSPLYRHGADRPKGPDGKPIGFQEALSPLDQASAAPVKKPSASKPSGVAMAAVAAPVATTLVAANPAPTPVEAPPPAAGPMLAPAETPMLDAALKRAEAIESEHRRIMRAEANAPDPSESKVKAVAFATAAKKPADDPPRDDAVQRAGAEAPAAPPVTVDKTKLWNAAAELVELLPADLSAAAVPATLPRAIALLTPAATEREPGPAVSNRDEPATFGINAVQLCRKIHGFGSFEPMDAQALRAGRPVLIYCELAGLRYEQQDDEYVSHVATRVELIDARDGSKAWEDLGKAEDRCRRRRLDSFVSTLVTLPETIVPGPYTIRLTQTDDIALQSATAELAVTIGR